MASTCYLAQQAPIAAYAFRAEVTKWLALVRLLLSDIPERAELAAPGLATALQPYFHLTNAVRTGSLATFQCVMLLALNRSRVECHWRPPSAVTTVTTRPSHIGSRSAFGRHWPALEPKHPCRLRL